MTQPSVPSLAFYQASPKTRNEDLSVEASVHADADVDVDLEVEVEGEVEVDSDGEEKPESDPEWTHDIEVIDESKQKRRGSRVNTCFILRLFTCAEVTSEVTQNPMILFK